MFLSFEFQKIGRKMWKLWGGRKSPSFIEKGTSLIQLLVAIAKAVKRWEGATLRCRALSCGLYLYLKPDQKG